MAKKDKIKMAYEQDAVLDQEVTNELAQEEKDFQDNLDTAIEKTNAELDNSINTAKQNVETAVGASTIGAAYNPTITSLGNKITEMEEAKKKAKEGDETAQRRARSMKMVAGISDGLASLANLIGVGSYGASNINTGSALTPLEQKMEAARLERKADIKTIDDRLEQYRNQLDQVRMQKGSALANYYQQKEKDAKADARHKEEMDYRKGRDAVADKQFAQKIEAMEADRTQRTKEAQNNYALGLKRLEMEAKEKGITGSYPVFVGENEILDIPKEKINNQTIGRIFDALPTKYKDLARGKEIYEYVDNGAYGQTKVGTGRYEQPSLNEMLAAIGAASKDDAKIQDELRKLAGTYIAPKPQEKSKETNAVSQPTAQTPSWMKTSQQLWQNATNYNDPFAEFE